MTFDLQAKREGYTPCARGEDGCQMEAVRPGKVQCPCDDPTSKAAYYRRLAESASVPTKYERS